MINLSQSYKKWKRTCHHFTNMMEAIMVHHINGPDNRGVSFMKHCTILLFFFFTILFLENPHFGLGARHC